MIDVKYKPKHVCLVYCPNFHLETDALVFAPQHCDRDWLRRGSLLRINPNLFNRNRNRNELKSILFFNKMFLVMYKKMFSLNELLLNDSSGQTIDEEYQSAI